MGNLLKRVVSCAMICLIGVAGTGITTVEMPITTISVSADETYKTWKQGDSRWGSMRLGGSSYTMSNSGCAATALSMLMVHAGSISDSNFTPETLCTFFNNNGGFSNKGDISWSVSSKLSSSFTFEGYDTLSSSDVSGKTSEIQKYLDAGYFLIVGVKSGGHWVAIDRIENGTVYMFDPATGKNVSLFDTYDNSGIYKVRKFKGANSVSTNNTTIEDTKEEVEELPNLSTNEQSEEIKNNTTSSYTTGVYKLNSELCLRTDAYSSADVIDILPLSTSINVSQVDGEWGYVCYNGNMGWINLGYTSKVQNDYQYETGTYTTAEPLNFREDNSTSADSFGLVPVNTAIEVLEVDDNWGRIEYQSKSAWICLDYVSAGKLEFSSAVNIATSNSDKKIGVYNTNDNLNIRFEQTTSSNKLGLIENDTDINIIQVDGNWGKTIYNGVVGWVCLDYADYKNALNSIPCDINQDGNVNSADLLYVSNNIKNNKSFTQSEIQIADLNGDGKVDYTDYQLFKRVMIF